MSRNFKTQFKMHLHACLVLYHAGAFMDITVLGQPVAQPAEEYRSIPSSPVGFISLDSDIGMAFPVIIHQCLGNLCPFTDKVKIIAFFLDNEITQFYPAGA
jgi:hypothetical protein